MRTPRLEMRTVAIALLVSLLLWNLPIGGYVMYPFKLLATWLHELSHGVAMTLTGAGFDYVLIYRDTSGLAYARERVGPVGTAIIAASGYMGTPLWGALLLIVTPTAKAARTALLVLGGVAVASAFTVIAQRPDDPFGPWAVGAVGGAFILCGLVLPAKLRLFVAHLVAVQSCVNALLDIRVLLRPLQVIDGAAAGASDAHNMANATFGTTDNWAVYTWAAIWLAWSLLMMFAALRFSGSPAKPRGAAGARATASPRDGSDRDAHRRNPVTAPDRTDPSAPADTEAP